MQRRTFVRTTLAALPLAAAFPTPRWAERSPKGFKIPAGEGRYHGHMQLKGVNQNVLDVKVSGKDTNGDLAIFEQTSLSQGRGTPLHIHPHQDEIFTVLDGEYAFLVGDDKYRLKTGDSIFLPRQVPHAWTQVSARGKMQVTLQPAGKLEDFFVAMAAFKTEPTPQQVADVFAACDMQVVGPPLKID
ncbi:cupin domain-containing protein [Hymenobacter chitinivorans]|uniref:Cupin domain-containing protein n=1 Tax=Hymenobacter chitinivorans DSM 11115 TaxID=1121954 RepID=A0A2M9BQ25_9BACT|nr:cupin domain-containing protein [Hymenobacter chitinivorans]PJJ60043.1 Cupin domain-containing protein [Hymenobacter chitinivorans DSM 11115]